MLSSDITLGLNTYSKQTQRANSAVWGDPARDLDKPTHLKVSHETAKSGLISSVIIFDSAEVLPVAVGSCNVVPVSDSIRVQFKVQRNPLSGRVGIEAELTRMVVELNTMLADATLMTRFYNMES